MMAEHGMEKLAALSNEERAEIFRETAAEGKMTEAAIEKDFWVCWALHRLFADASLSKELLFKGGTSLSKCYGVIDRFSEDIDLILDWRLLTDEEPYQERSNTQQDKFNKEMEARAQKYVQTVLQGQVNDLMKSWCGIIWDEQKPKSLRMTYPRAFDSAYIKPEVELEISPMSAMIPNKEFRVQPYCSDVAKTAFGDMSLNVKAIEAKKTFWDKITILHAEAHRPKEKDMPSRYSRHYYDIYRLLNSPVHEDAMQDMKLLQEVVVFKHKFYPQGWANYEGAKMGKFRLVPEPHRVDFLQKDYAQMQEMIFGDYPKFEEILQAISKFENRLNGAA